MTEEMLGKKSPRGSRFTSNMTAALICCAFAALAFFSVAGFRFGDLKRSGDSITSDEVPHITSGYYYLKSGRYFLNPEHPPLVKDISALPIRIFLNPDFPEVSAEAPYPSEAEKEDLFFNKKIFPRVLEIENYHWDNRMLIFNPQNNPDLIILLARTAVIIFNALLLFALYLLVKKHWGGRAALIGLFLISFSPFMLAHGSLVTTDFTASALQMSALASFAVFSGRILNRSKYLSWFLLSVLFFALAMLAKFSSLAILPAALAGGFIYILANNRRFKPPAVYFGLCLALAALSFSLVIGYYSFHVRNSDPDGIVSQLNQNYPTNLPKRGKDILIAVSHKGVMGRAAATYSLGLSMVANRLDTAGQTTYFMGKVYGSEGAGPWYFPVLYLTKIPLPAHLLSLFALTMLIFGQKFILSIKKISPLGFILTVFAVLYAYQSVSSNLNIGLRHFMPVIFAAMLLTAKGIGNNWDKNIALSFQTRHFYRLAAALFSVSAILAFPHYLSYYNILGGGTNHGYEVATDSNYDWGQDVKRLGVWLKKNKPGKIYLDIFSLNAPGYYLGNSVEYFDAEKSPAPPPGSYVAVSAMNYQNNVYDDSIPPEKKYSSGKYVLVERVGKTIFIFTVI